jgi:1,4-alpha-glucan branching enzyme
VIFSILASAVFNSDSQFYGGSNVGNAGAVVSVADGESSEICLVLPPLAALFLVPEL